MNTEANHTHSDRHVAERQNFEHEQEKDYCDRRHKKIKHEQEKEYCDKLNVAKIQGRRIKESRMQSFVLHAIRCHVYVVKLAIRRARLQHNWQKYIINLNAALEC